MQIPTRIVFHGLDRSPALEENIQEHVAKLETFTEHLIGCQVTLQANQHRQTKGKQYHVRIVCQVPRKSLVVSHDRNDKPGHEDPYVAVRDGFRAATRQIEDWERKIRGDVKHHEPKPTQTSSEADRDQESG